MVEDSKVQSRVATGCGVLLVLGTQAGWAQDNLGSHLEVVEHLRLEETDDVLVAEPYLVKDPSGGWLYWDSQAEDVRLYAGDGALLNHFGGPGEGPGEFRRLVGAVRTAGGAIATIDGGARLSRWSQDGDSLLGDFATGLRRPSGLAPSGPGEVIVYTSPAVSESNQTNVPVLFRLNLENETVAELPFRARLTETTLGAALTVDSPPPVVYDGHVYFAMVPLDSLWAVSLDGSDAGHTIPIPSEAIRSNPPAASTSEGREAFMAWVGESTFPGRFFRMSGGGWLMQTWGLRSGEPTRGIVRFDDKGNRLWEMENTLDVAGVDGTTGEIVLWDRNGLDPAEFLVVREAGSGP